MTNYREILRLHSLGLNKTEIAASLHCARNTVAATLQRAGNCGLQWPLPDEMSDKQLAVLLFPSASGKPAYKMPDYDYVYREMQKSGVTLNLLWLEYCDQCKAAGEIPYQSTQFNKYYSDYLNKTNATMHLNHKPGEVMQVDWTEVCPLSGGIMFQPLSRPLQPDIRFLRRSFTSTSHRLSLRSAFRYYGRDRGLPRSARLMLVT